MSKPTAARAHTWPDEDASEERLSLVRERHRARKAELGLVGREHAGGSTHLYVVETDALASLIEPYLAEHDANHSGVTRGAHTTRHVSARVWLASQLRTDPSVVSRILTRASTYTGLPLADDTLTACGMVDAFQHLDVYANPAFSCRLWVERATAAGIVDPIVEWVTHAAPKKWSSV